MDPIYRMTIYVPRSVDPDEATVLTPESGASHSDPFKIATATGVTGFKLYMGMPRGRTGRVDPLRKSTDTGQLTVPAFDIRTTEGGSNLSRWLTAFAGDSKGRNKLLGRKVYVEISTDDGSTWSSYFTGRVQKFPLTGRAKFNCVVRDMREGLDAEIFVGPPHSNVTYTQMCTLMPNGLLSPYASFPTVPKLTGTVHVSGGQTALDPDWSNDSHKYWSYFTKEWPGAVEDGKRALFRDNDEIRIYLKILSGAGERNGESGEFTWVGCSTGDEDVAYKDEKGHWRLRSPVLKELDSADPDYLLLPPDDAYCEYYIYHRAPPTESAPILIDEVNVVQLWRDMLDGYFCRLDIDGDPLRTVPYDSTAFTALIADDSIPTGRFYITKEAVMKQWIEKYICQVYNLSYYLDADGQVVPLDMRLPSSLAGIPTIDNNDIYAEPSPGWEPDRGSAITVMEATYYSDERLSPDGFEEAPPGFVDLPATLIDELPMKIRLQDFGNLDLGESLFEIDAIGFRTTPNWARAKDGIGMDEWVVRHLERTLKSMRGPFGSGAAYANIPCKRSIDALAQSAYGKDAVPGLLWLVDVDELPDPATNLRGGKRLMRCIERGEDGPRLLMVFLDMGPDTVSVAPTMTTPTSPDKNSVSVAVTLNGSSEPVNVEYAITETSVGTRPVEGSPLWIYGGTVTTTSTLTIDRIPSGKRVWIRARTEVTGTDEPKLPSTWAFPSPTSRVDTASLTAPTGCTASNKTASTADISWSNGESGYPIDVLLVLGASPSGWSEDDLVAVLTPGTTQFTLRGLDGPSTQHTVAVRHRDPYIGVSAVSEHTFTTGATAPTAPRPAGIALALTGTREM